MATLYLAQPEKHRGHWFDYPRRRIQESYGLDVHGTHRLVDSPEAADAILFATNYSFPVAELGLWGEPVFRRHHARCVLFSTTDIPSPVVGGLCPSWPGSISHPPGLAAGWCYHHPGAAEATLTRQEWPRTPRYLWSFKGSRSTHPVRDAILRLSDPEGSAEDTSQASLPNLMGQTREEEKQEFVRDYIARLASSEFILCPRGAGASSMRIFEGMRAGRAPVIISDDWTPPPFVHWDQCSLRLGENEVARLPDFLRQHRASAEALGQRAGEEWSRVFGPQGLFHHTAEICLRLCRERAEGGAVARAAQGRYLLQKPWSRDVLSSFKHTVLSSRKRG